MGFTIQVNVSNLTNATPEERAGIEEIAAFWEYSCSIRTFGECTHAFWVKYPDRIAANVISILSAESEEEIEYYEENATYPLIIAKSTDSMKIGARYLRRTQTTSLFF